MKVLLVTNYFSDASRGGVEYHVQSLADELILLGHSVTILRTSELPQQYDVGERHLLTPFATKMETRYSLTNSKLAKVPAFRMAFNFVYRRKLGKQAVNWLQSEKGFLEKFDIVHHHDFITSVVISSFISKHYPAIPQFWTNHLGEFILMNKLPIVGNFLTKRLTGKFVYAFAPSRELSNAKGIACRVEMIPNGANCKTFSPLPQEPRSSMRRSLGWAEGELVVIVPRRWAPTKGVLYVAQALADLPKGLSLRCVFVGASESDFEEYSRGVHEALLKAKVPIQIIGSVGQQEMSNLLSASDLCLIPSLLEAVSLSALESLACATPVLATNVGGLPEVIIEGKTGWLMNPKSSEEIAANLQDLVRMDREILKRMGLSGRDMVEDKYSWESVARRVSIRYEEQGLG